MEIHCIQYTSKKNTTQVQMLQIILFYSKNSYDTALAKHRILHIFIKE